MPHTIAENLTRLQNAKTAIGNAITAKGGTVASGDGLEEYAADIATIPSGGTVPAERKDVNFYDYDGTCVYSYTADEFAELSALPANPTHTGLTAQGWNWSLADAKAYVADYGMLDIGQMYITDDGKTRLYITLTEGRLKPYLGLTGNSVGTTVSIDWGDGSVAESVTLDTVTVYTPHEYVSGGDYVITIAVVSGSISLTYVSSQSSNLLRKSATPDDNQDDVYRNTIVKCEIGNDISLSSGAFQGCDSLQSVTLPRNVLFSSLALAFENCISLKCIIFSSELSQVGGNMMQYCRSLKVLCIPKDVTLSTSAFRYCDAIQSINLPNVSEISLNICQNNSALSQFIVPKTVTKIGTNIVSGCYGIGYLKFTPTTPPSIANVNAWTNIPSDCYILVPYDTLDDYLNETNMPDDSVYLYLCFAKYAEGVTLPIADSDGYNLTWYATKDDARNGTNPITVGNGKEVYAIGV